MMGDPAGVTLSCDHTPIQTCIHDARRRACDEQGGLVSAILGPIAVHVLKQRVRVVLVWRLKAETDAVG